MGAAIVALYFGLRGNKETRILIKQAEQEFDYEAFEFLTMIPNTMKVSSDEILDYNQNITVREFIGAFEAKVLKNIYFGRKSLKRYNSYIDLAKKYERIALFKKGGLRKQQKIFNKIKRAAEKLSLKLDLINRLSGLQRLWEYESLVYWDKNIFLLYPDVESDSLPKIVIYAKNEETSRDVVGQKINPNFLDKSVTNCEKISPTRYTLIDRSSRKIKIIHKYKKLSLIANIPQKYI